MKKNNVKEQGNSRQRFSIRKYSIGTVSILAATFFIVSGNVSQAASESQNHTTSKMNLIGMPHH